MAEFKETRRQSGIQKKHGTGQKRREKKTKTLLGQIWHTKHTGLNQSVQDFKTN
jgi:hypothetical protein